MRKKLTEEENKKREEMKAAKAAAKQEQEDEERRKDEEEKKKKEEEDRRQAEADEVAERFIDEIYPAPLFSSVAVQTDTSNWHEESALENDVKESDVQRVGDKKDELIDLDVTRHKNTQQTKYDSRDKGSFQIGSTPWRP